MATRCFKVKPFKYKRYVSRTIFQQTNLIVINILSIYKCLLTTLYNKIMHTELLSKTTVMSYKRFFFKKAIFIERPESTKSYS